MTLRIHQLANLVKTPAGFVASKARTISPRHDLLADDLLSAQFTRLS